MRKRRHALILSCAFLCGACAGTDQDSYVWSRQAMAEQRTSSPYDDTGEVSSKQAPPAEKKDEAGAEGKDPKRD